MEFSVANECRCMIEMTCDFLQRTSYRKRCNLGEVVLIVESARPHADPGFSSLAVPRCAGSPEPRRLPVPTTSAPKRGQKYCGRYVGGQHEQEMCHPGVQDHYTFRSSSEIRFPNCCQNRGTLLYAGIITVSRCQRFESKQSLLKIYS